MSSGTQTGWRHGGLSDNTGRQEFYAKSDNRDTKGGCFAGRDVHSNPNKDKDGVGTPEHLNEIGKWMQSNVSNIGNGKGGKGLWCTNCHNQLSRELYQRDNLKNAFKQTGETIRNQSLDDIAKAIGVSRKTLEQKYLDLKSWPIKMVMIPLENQVFY